MKHILSIVIACLFVFAIDMRWDEKFAIEDMVIEDISSVLGVLDNLSLQHGVGLGVLLAYNDWDHGVSHAYTYNLNK